MALFKQKEKPDIPKDAPKKKGFVLVLSTIWREFFGLIKLNFIFLLSSLAIVTIPASIKAMSRITIAMVRDENYFLWHDYWEAFKDDFWKSFFGGLLFFLALLLLGLSTYFYWYVGVAVHWALLVLAALSIALLLWVYVASLYFFPMNAYVNLKFGQLLKNSVLLVFHGWKRSGLAFLSALIFLFGSFLLFPYSSLILFVIAVPLTNLLVSFALYPMIEKKVVQIEQGEVPQGEAEEQYLRSATFKGWDDDPEETEESEGKNAE
ncbi:MAG: YesL family protein [Lachnospiraceae bacterium]|nr:YesL family protein [Lachnospiraceae bacterium]